MLRPAFMTAAASLMMMQSAFAEPPADADPLYGPYFNALRVPSTNGSCCGYGDCRSVEAEEIDGHWHAHITGEEFEGRKDEWIRVPDDPNDKTKNAIVTPPDPKLPRPRLATACMMGGKLVCFDKPLEPARQSWWMPARHNYWAELQRLSSKSIRAASVCNT